MTKQDRSSLWDNPREQIEVNFLGLRMKCSNPSSKTIIILAIILIFYWGMYMAFFFQLKKENPLSSGYKQFFEQTKIRAPAKTGSG